MGVFSRNLKRFRLARKLTQEQAARLDNEFTITVKAQAVQTQNVGAETPTVDNGVQKSAAWTSFDNLNVSIAD